MEKTFISKESMDVIEDELGLMNEFATNHAKVYVTSKMHTYPEDIEKQIKDETLPEILNVLDVHTKKNVSEVNKCSSVKSIQEMTGVMRYFENFLDADLSFSKNTDEFFKIAGKLNRKNSYYKNDMFMETDRVSPTEREKGLKMEQNFTAFVKDLQKTTEIYWERIKDDVFSMNNAEFMYRYGGSKKDGVIRDRKAAIFIRSLTNAAYLYANEYAKEINKRIEKLSQVFLAERKPSDRYYVKEDFKNLDMKDVQKLFKDNHFFLAREYYDGNNIKWEDVDGTKPNNLSSQIVVYDLDKNNEMFSPAALFESKYFNSYSDRTEHFADVLQKFYEHGKQWETNKESVMEKWEEAFKRDNYDKHPEVFHWGPYGEAHNKAELIKIYSEEYDNHLKICKGLEKMIERKKVINLTPDFKEGQGNGLKK